MSDLTLDDYAQDLIADVLATAEAESTTTPETFTRRALDDLEQAGVTENTFAAYHRAHGVEVSGYGSNESLGSARRVRQLLPPVPARVTGCAGQRPRRCSAALLAFVQRCRDGLRQQIDESDDVYDMCLGVEKKLPEVSAAPAVPAHEQRRHHHLAARLQRSDDLPVSYEIWDLTRFHRMATSGTLSEPIIVEFDDPLPCLATPADRTGTSPSSWPSCPAPSSPALYGQYGTRLLELNVRSFLQAKGAVNRGIRDTLLTEPGTVPRLQQRHHRDRLERRVHRRFPAAARPSAASTTCRSSTAARPPRRSTTPTSRTRPTSPGSSCR